MAHPEHGSRFGFALLIFFALVLGAAFSAQAGTDMCSYYPVVDGYHVINGNDPSLTPLTLPSSIGIDADCLFENFPISAKWPRGLTSTINFKFDGYLAIFNNVYYSGNMACANTTTKIWFVNNSQYVPNNSCQSLFIPVETIGKKSPAATASIGVPFTYTLTVPVMFDPATGTYYNEPSANTIHSVTIYDDLTQMRGPFNSLTQTYPATGADITYVSANLVEGTTRTPLVLGASPATLSNLSALSGFTIQSDTTKHLVFSSDYNPSLANIPAGSQVVIELTVVLDNTPGNVAGNTFINTAQWWFGRLIDGVFHAPLPGQSGISSPMAITGPNLTLTKMSPTSTINLGLPANFTLNVQNTGGGDAWDTTILDNLPAGMCKYDPRSTVTAQIFASDGTTLVSNLVNGTDFQLTWNGGTASPCQLGLTTLDTPIAKIGPTQRLIIKYQAQIDSTGVASGTTLVNVAGATRWFSGDSSETGRRQYGPYTLTDGTPNVLDFQDTFTITAALAGYYLQKTVQDLTTGVSTYSATTPLTAFPGDRVRYTLLLQNFTWPTLSNITMNDDLGAQNTQAAFVPGSLTLAGTDLPVGTYTVCSTCGTNGAGTISINGLSIATNQQYRIQVDVTLASTLTNGTTVFNQASLSGTDSIGKVWSGVSDDPLINGTVLLGSGGDKTSLVINAPGALSKSSPVPSTATIGQQFSYIITVPSTAATIPLYDVHILDNLPVNVSFVSAQVVSGGTWNLTNTGTATSLDLQDRSTGIDIPAGGQAVISITVAVQNTTANTSGVSFTNSASYTYNKINGGGGSTLGTGGAGVSAPMNVVEPHLTVTKTMSYASPAGKPATSPAAQGDVLQYTVTIPNSGSSTAFDTDVIDTLPANVSLVPGSAMATIGGGPVTGFVVNPTTLPGGALVWGRQNGDRSLDIPAGQSLVLTYRVSVLSINGTPITNSVYVDWSSLNDDITGERTGAGCPTWTSPNNYCSGPASTSVSTLDPTAFAKSVVSDSWNPVNDSFLRVGDTVVYSLALTLREGVTQNVVVTDTLPAGLAFDSLVSIAPASGSSNFTYTVASQPAPGATGTLTWNLGNITNAVDNNPANNTLVIQYRARVLKNTLPQTPTAQTLTNSARLNYAINGVAAAPKTSGASINVWKPMLSVSKSAVPAAGGTVLYPNELVTYTVNIQNTGNAPAYDTVLQDVIPVGMRNGAATITMVSVSLVNAGTTLPNVAPTFSSATGVAVWNFDSGVANQYAIPAGDTLRVIYRVQTDPALGAGMTLVNAAQVQHYYSFDSRDVPTGSTVTDRQDYGATSVATVQLTTASAMALTKQVYPLVTTAAIGQPFTYRITIPATPQSTAIYDVRVLDNLGLATTGVNMSFVSAQRVSGPAFTPVNTGTATNPVIQDTTNGIDIPAGQQAVLDVTIVLNDDIVNNTAGKLFQNTATYTFNSVNNNNATVANGAPGTSGAITIIGPNLTVQKSGPVTMRAGIPGAFRLNVQNTGTGTAWNTTVTDVLPNVTSPATGGMCASAPANVTARIYQADGVTPVSAPLVSGTDFSVSFAGAPACTWTIAMRSSAAAIPPADRLIVNYTASLDPGTASNLALTNIAGATQWQSADPAVPGAAGHVHTFANTLTNGTPGVLDYQDAFTVATESPVLTFTKTVYNVTTGQPGTNARPGDTLKYTLTIQNMSTLNATNFSLTDELDKLNSTAMFAPGSLTLVRVPAGANTSLTSATGGTKGTGLVNIGNLNIDPQGGANSTLVIEFQARLAPVITSGSVVLNQGQIGAVTLPTQLSGTLPGNSDPTSTRIASAPAFRVLKTAQDITSGTTTVLAGDTLRYTITVKNIGTENAIGVTLRDQIPANTSYVANSTRLNGVVVADTGANVTALQSGISINSPADPTAGAMPADAGAATANVATVTFDVKISTSVVNGTIISNQGFANGSGRGSGPFPEQPSDNPATPVLNDPTTVIVGNLPLVSALKTVQLVVDNNNNGNVDPGDVLQYTITLTNSGATPATGVVLTDAVPANTGYVANSTVMNGGAVPDPSASVSPLASGIGVVSSGQTPPSPLSSGGTLAAGGTGIVTFKVQVNAGVPTGTVISNQGSVATAQLPALPTDADGDASNGYQPTVITVGNAQMLTITKQVAVVGGGTAEVGAELEYLVRVTNTGTVAATNVTITDVLPGQLSYVTGSAVLNGSIAGITVTGPVITADYSSVYGNLPANGTAVLRFHAKIVSGSIGTTITNRAQVTWNTPTQNASGSASVDIGGTPGNATLNGRVWHDANFNKTCDSNERYLTGWTVQVYRNSQLLGSVLTDSDGFYRINGLAPTGSSDSYELQFSAPGATATTAKLGLGHYPFNDGQQHDYPQRIANITAVAGSNMQNLDLPIDPSGVVYDSIRRTPIAGATVAMVRASTNSALPASCFADPAQQNQVTLSQGFYKFDLNFSDPSCPSGADYLIRVTPPANGYRPTPSGVIAPTTSETTAPFSVPGCPGSADDAIPATATFCEAQPSELAPATNVPAGSVGTKYYLHILLSNSAAGGSDLFNNHIPLDPPLNTAVSITKTALLLNVSRGQMVPYTITVKNTLGATLADLSVVDRFPPGFKYVEGSARLDGSPLEPVKTTRDLRWNNLQLTSGDHVIKLLLVVGAGVKEGDYDNSAQVLSSTTGEALTTVATARVRIVPDPTFDCTDIIGKVFDDANANGYPDPDEKGLGGVRIVSARGLIVTTDKEGRFHITCAAVPNEERGGNFILKLDDRTLPTGYRVTTENPLVRHVTRGKAIKFNFGATLHRVVRLDIADGVFEPGSTEMREQWKPRIDMLLEELRKARAILRISYLADVEDPAVVKARTEAVKREIAERWKQESYELTIETEIFWRRGGPPARRPVVNDGQ